MGEPAHLPELGCIGIVLLPLPACKAVYLGLQALCTPLLLLGLCLGSLQPFLLKRQALRLQVTMSVEGEFRLGGDESDHGSQPCLAVHTGSNA